MASVYKILCHQCGTRFQASLPMAKWCSRSCETRAHYARVKAAKEEKLAQYQPPIAVAMNEGDDDGLPSILDRVTRKLETLPDESWQKALAFRLAHRLDHSALDSAASVAKMVNELDRLMVELDPHAKGEVRDELDEIQDEVAEARKRRRA